MENDQEIKQDAGKPRMSLVPMTIITDIAQVREFGIKKYPAESWREVAIERYLDAFLRHAVAMAARGIDEKDEESGIEHYKHAACNLAFICALMERMEEEENENFGSLRRKPGGL